jgi:hypothetical protein
VIEQYYFLRRSRKSSLACQQQREAVRLVRDLRQEAGRPELPLPPQEDPQRRQTSQVSVLYKEIYPEVIICPTITVNTSSSFFFSKHPYNSLFILEVALIEPEILLYSNLNVQGYTKVKQNLLCSLLL